MYTTLIVSTVLIFAGAALSFIKDVYSIHVDNKPKMENIFPFAAFILGLSGVFLSFNESKKNIDSKFLSDSTRTVWQNRYDSLEGVQINLLGGGNIKPEIHFFQVTPDQFNILIMDTSIYTIRDLSVTITDNEALKTLRKKINLAFKDSIAKNNYLTTLMINKGGDYQQFMTVPFLTYQTLRSTVVNVANKNHINYTIDMYYTGGSLSYYIFCTRMKDGWRKDSVKLYDRISGITKVE